LQIKKDIIWRIAVSYAFVLIVALVIVVRLIVMQFSEGEFWRHRALDTNEKDVILYANRGDIYAEDGRLLASSIPYYELRMDFVSASDELFDKGVDSLATCLSDMFRDRSKTEYLNFLLRHRKNKSRFVLLRKKVNYIEFKKVKTFPILRASKFRGGLISISENRRVQPHINLATRTIGYLLKGENNELYGKVGLEGAYESELKGKNGLSLDFKMSNMWVPVTQLEPKDGNDIITTIDVNFQDVAETALLNQLKKYKAQNGTVVLMEVETGDIKAIANLGRNKSSGLYSEDYNYAIGSATEPGSTFKLASMLALLEDDYVDLTDSIDTGNGVYDFYDRKMRDSHYGGYGKISISEVFEKSSNIGISRLIFDNYKRKPDDFIDRLDAFHLRAPLGIEITGEGLPNIKYSDDPTWSGISLAWMSIGYELQLTPLQILTFYNTIANNGCMVKPRFVKEIQYHGELVKKNDITVLESSICSRSSLKKVQHLLEGVVERGTARNLKNKNYKIAGKTGTAQIANNNKGYKRKSYQASFVGYFPADEPKYSCIVVIWGPDKKMGFYGSQVASPVFKVVADKVYASSYSMHQRVFEKNKYKNEMPISSNGRKKDFENIYSSLDINVSNPEFNSEWIITTRQKTNIKYQKRRIHTSLVPNVGGMGLNDALFILENKGFKVNVRGVGVVVRQSLKAGTRYKIGAKIKIVLA